MASQIIGNTAASQELISCTEQLNRSSKNLHWFQENMSRKRSARNVTGEDNPSVDSSIEYHSGNYVYDYEEMILWLGLEDKDNPPEIAHWVWQKVNAACSALEASTVEDLIFDVFIG